MDMQNKAEKDVKLEQPVDFSYPEGFEKMAALLTEFPDQQTREMMLSALVSVALWL